MGGAYLSSFIDQMNRQRVLEEASSRNQGFDAAQVFQIDQYLKNLDKENQAEQILTQMLRNRQRAVPQPPMGAPPAAPPGGPPVIPPGQPTLPGGPPPLPGDQPMAAPVAAPMPQEAVLPSPGMAPPPNPLARPPVQDALMAGLTPEQQARFMTSKTGAAVLPSLEATERERRKSEDEADAESIFKKAQQHFNAKQPADWADMMAAGYRRKGDAARAAHFMEYAAKVRVDQHETEAAKRDFVALNKAVKKYQTDPSPENLASLHDAMTETESLTGRALALEMTKNQVAKGLSADHEESAFLTAVTQARVTMKMPEDKAWEAAIARYPGGAAKLYARSLMNPDHTRLPDGFYAALRVPPPAPTKDPTIGQRAYTAAMAEAQVKGVPTDGMPFLRLVEQHRLRLVEEEERAKAKGRDTGLEGDIKRARLDRLKALLERAKDPNPKTMKDISLEIQRLNQDIASGNMDSEEERDAREALKTLRELRDQKQREMGGKGDEAKAAGPSKLPPPAKYKGQTIRNPETGERYTSDGTKWTKL